MSSDPWHSDVVGCFRSVERLKPTFHRTGEQKFHKAVIAGASPPFKEIFTTIKPLDLKLLPRLDLIFTAYFGGNYDLAFGGYGSSHRDVR
jgi:hypothetical protein